MLATGQPTGLVQAFETDLHQHVLRLVVTLVLEARHREKGQVLRVFLRRRRTRGGVGGVLGPGID